MKMQIKHQISRRILYLAVAGFLMVSTSCLMFFSDPLEFIIKKVLELSQGTIFFSLWSAPPYEILMKIYAFNITNPEQFLKGEEKMNLTEIGPYVYREILTNNNATFGEDGTVSFQPHRDFALDEVRSVGDPKKDILLTTNLPLVGIQSFLNDASFFSNIGFSTISRNLGAKPILRLTLDDYLWGYDDKLVKVANQFIPSWIDFKRFGILERLMSRDNTNTVTIAANPSKFTSPNDDKFTKEEKMSQYHIVKWNDSPGLPEWGYKNGSDTSGNKKCHLVEGAYDGTIFPRDLRVKRSLTLFRKAFCRPVPLTFVEEGRSKQGFKVYNYKFADNIFDTPDKNPDNECFCYKNECVKGLQNIAPCYYGIPVVLSQPHFFNSDPSILETVNGLNPDPEKHGSICHIQPDLGVPLGGHMRIQINLGVGETKYNSRTRIFNGLTIPLFWIEMTTGELPTLVSFLVTLVVNVLPIALEIVKYLLCLGGLALISTSAIIVLFYSKVNLPGRISLSSDYSPIPIINIPSQYFNPDKLICK